MDVVFGRELTQRTGCAEYRLPVLFVLRRDGSEQRHCTLSRKAGGGDGMLRQRPGKTIGTISYAEKELADKAYAGVTWAEMN